MYFFTAEKEAFELTEKSLLLLSRRLTKEAEIHSLAVDGLEMKNHVIDKFLSDNKGDITTAAYKLLNEWFKNQSDRKTAYVNICRALKDAEMEFYIKDVLE